MSVSTQGTEKHDRQDAISPRGTKPETEKTKTETDKIKVRESDNFWHMVDHQFKEITKAGLAAFVINKYINVILVIIGVALVGNSILYTWLKSVDAWSTLMGGIGIGAFVVIFFNNSQSNINKAVASLASIFMIYKGHSREYETITDYDYEMQVKPGPRDIEEIIKMDQELERSTDFYVNLVNEHLEAFKATIDEPQKKVPSDEPQKKVQ